MVDGFFVSSRIALSIRDGQFSTDTVLGHADISSMLSFAIEDPFMLFYNSRKGFKTPILSLPDHIYLKYTLDQS